MKIILKKLTCLALVLMLLLTAQGAMAASLNSATITMPSSEWEGNFQNMLAYMEENGVQMTDNPVFAVAEFPDRDAIFRFEHTLDLAGFMRLAYYDDGADVFNSAILTINLEHGGMPADLAWLTMYLTVLAGDTNTTTEEFDELMGVICPIFNEVFSGEKRVNGSEVATLRGVGYALEINEAERVMRLFTNVAITQNDPQ